jgi:hypothetical protein
MRVWVDQQLATRLAQGVALLILLAGVILVGLDAYRSGLTPVGPTQTTSMTKDVKETRSSIKGPETTERHEVTTALTDTTLERALGSPGLLLARLLLVLLASFVTGAAVQRVFLGEFSLKLGPVELLPIPPAAIEPLVNIGNQLVEAFASAQIVTAAKHIPANSISSDETETVREQAISDTTRIADLLKLMNPNVIYDYAIIDIGEGQSWLSTRLFLLAVLLSRMQRLRALVFVEKRDEIFGRFVGIAAPDYVRWRLARAYPWFELAIAKAYSAIDDLDICSDAGALSPNSATRLVYNFINGPEITSFRTEESDDWQFRFPGGGMSEHATWINRTLLDRLFDPAPSRSSIFDAGDLTGKQRILTMLACDSPFVAVVDDQNRFQSLIDRERILRALSESFLRDLRRVAASDRAK